MRIQRIAVGGALCLLLGLFWGTLSDQAEAAGQKGKPPANNCNHLTAAAAFRDDPADGIRSDGLILYPGVYGSPSEYHGWEDSTVCLMMFDDYDFIMGTSGKSFEKTGVDRKVVLDFGNQAVPFASSMAYDVSIRSDYVYNLSEPGPVDRRLIVWFTANRVDYKLFFDDYDESTDMVQVTVSGTSPNRIWTIESAGTGRLEKARNRVVVGYFTMPFKITIHETSYPNTCF